jgi:DNA (cytosine-5)-methyltransferase 1
LANIKANAVDLIVGGPPCQGFSSAGTRLWDDPRNRLLKNFVDNVVKIRPTWFILENVEGLLTANDGYFVIESITQFLKAGYTVRAKKVYMECHGVPQRRKRVFIVGNLEGVSFSFPRETHVGESWSLFSHQSALSIMDAIDDLPNPNNKTSSN